MRVFAENPNSVLDEFSSEFERGYLETLNQLHGTKRVKANKVYQEYIQDKHHIHMNATIWTTLTGFCMHLGKESKAIVDETEKGWFIQYIDRDPKVLARQAQNEQRQKFELDEEERRKREILAQVQAAEERKRGEGGGSDEEEVDNAMVREENDQKIAVSLAPAVTAGVGLKKRPRAAMGFEESDDDEADAPAKKANGVGHGGDGNGSASGVVPGLAGHIVTSAGRVMPHTSSTGGGVLAQMMQEDERRKQARLGQSSQSNQSAPVQSSASSSKPPVAEGSAKTATTSSITQSSRPDAEKSSSKPSWLYKNIVVKVVSKEVARGRIYKLKGRVVRLVGRDYEEADIDIDGQSYTVHFKDLETTLPKVGQPVLVLSGRAKGLEAELVRIHEDKFNCDVRVTQRGSSLAGEELRGLEYDDVCKYTP